MGYVRRMRWRALGLLVALAGCNTFDDPGSDIDFGAPPPSRPPSVNPPPLIAGSGVAGMFGPVVAGSSGAGPFPGGWQPIDAGPSDADGGSEDAGD